MKLYLKYHSIGVYVDTWGMRDCKIEKNFPYADCADVSYAILNCCV